MAEKQQPLTLSPREAAPMVPMGINQFYAAVREGVVPSLRIGNSIRIPRKKFIAWLNGENVTPGDNRTPQDAA
ncbi:helix-turn-helix domain-containing protein [Arthrobacter sp. B2a2-09]|uniref:helix-turn-helix domain-containing protein n=1 Tax=Arthrobacter sp. B2a2-09 TaxID=2952822 RepID=UPI0022CD436D|nr:helix-turn-helix domain-containing protein [Arthrobacter sp. B2a2-09]MCZ9884058.1 helix-turn-helix domain-containing protein [Arthrobacter sp. B2a2-09]